MATKITDLTELATTAASGDFLHIIDVADPAGGTAGTSKKIQVSNLPGGGGAVDSVNGQTGVVSLGVQDLDDVAGGAPSTGDVISYTAGTWVLNSGLQTLLARFKASGTGAQVFDSLNDTSKGYVDVQSTSAKIGLAETTIDISQTSPGAMTFGVAAGGSGVETQYNAAFLNGQTTAGTAHLLLKSGTEFRLENAGGYETWLRQNPSAAANITVGLPSTGGTLALTTDIPSVPVDSVNGQTGVVVLDTDDINEGTTNLYYTEARVDANPDVVANTAKVGITPTQASAITANTAKVSNVQSDWNASSGLAVILNKPTLTSGTVTSVAMTVPSAFAISGSPITTSGTLALSVGGTTSQYLDGTGALQTFPTIPTQGLLAVVDDTSPQLGGNLDVNGFTITSTGNADIDIEPDGTGDINLKADTLNLTDNSNSARFEIAAGYVRLISTTVGTIWQANTGSNRFDISQPLALGAASPSSSQKLAIRAGNSQTYIVFESSTNVEVGNFSNDSSGNISFTLDGDITTTETLDAVNLTINGAQGTDGQVLTSTGTGVGWEDSGGGGGGVTAVTGTSPIVSSGGSTPAISITAATTSAAGSMSAADKTKLNDITTPYEEDEIFAGQNITMNTAVSVASNRIADIMGDALADTSNANSKKFIGYHTGSGVCVLQGMVDAGASISGATNGGPLWIGASGAFSATAPTTANYYSRVVGYYVGNGVGGEEIVYFDPSKDWVQIS